MSTIALLTGVRTLATSGINALISSIATESRPKIPVYTRPLSDGAPFGAYERSGGWFVGSFFGGASLEMPDSLKTIYTVGIDLTRVLTMVSSKKRGIPAEQENEFNSVAMKLAELLIHANSSVANACNAALVGTSDEGHGVFRENFKTVTIGSPQERAPGWLLGVAAETQIDAPVLSVNLRATGLVWRKLRGELFSSTGNPT